MSSAVNFDHITIEENYSRERLAKLWATNGIRGFSRGVFTPAQTNLIILFVTQKKDSAATQYDDYIIDDFLYWDGEEKGQNNNRVINARKNKEEIHLFYRQSARQNFKYHGLLELLDYVIADVLPYKFIFQIIGSKDAQSMNILEENSNVDSGKKTEKLSQVLSRIGQGQFRVDLFTTWESCAVTGIPIPEVLKASHIKPWKDSDDAERLDPYNGLLLTANLDSLFDSGLVTFENNGKIIIAKRIQNYTSELNISDKMSLRHVFSSNVKYLEYHRKKVFSDNASKR